jgi:hypothetical protein
MEVLCADNDMNGLLCNAVSMYKNIAVCHGRILKKAESQTRHDTHKEQESLTAEGQRVSGLGKTQQ